MVDHWANTYVHPTMDDIANYVPRHISANSITLTGFAVGLFAVPLLWLELYPVALILILVNRFLDGLDGAVARRNGVTNLGGYLDITCDFIFYSAVILGFALAAPDANGLAASFLIFSFVGTGSSFLAFAVIAEKHGISSDAHGQKAFYYLGGLTEGTETIVFYIVVCLFPAYFPMLAVMFGSLCWLTVIGRFGSAYSLLRN
ncbi:MAG: CDP-alcohol phosphatidyltransferase family protein [SAR324 cluster bacterium]|nr:CDP-alcohol phosphatidyltransferase family protein [SAR324 cluster bacterium]MBL7035805.1 CDP-alcohol phosphatidyltransferase family protein [SAR324 cluster bacterium]